MTDGKAISDTALHAKVDALSLAFAEHKRENLESHNKLRGELNRHGEEEMEMTKKLYGNGEAGVFERLRNLEKFSGQVIWLVKIQVGAMVLGAGTLVWEMVAAFFARGGG